jgi:hypothetical protein
MKILRALPSVKLKKITKNKMSKNLSQIRRTKEDLTQFTEMNFFKILTWVLLFLLFKIMKFGKSTAAINLAHSSNGAIKCLRFYSIAKKIVKTYN